MFLSFISQYPHSIPVREPGKGALPQLTDEDTGRRQNKHLIRVAQQSMAENEQIMYFMHLSKV